METDLRYPVGKFEWPSGQGPEEWIEEIASAPARLRAAVENLSADQLDTPYRPGGWTVRQVVHHLADSHLNSYARFRWALTEEEPAVKPYDEKAWAELADARAGEAEVSLRLLEALHARWVALLRSLSPADFARTFRHPEHGAWPLDKNLALYAWHGRHHTAQITALRERMGWPAGSDAASTVLAMERAALARWGRGDPSGFLEISDPGVVYFDPFQPRRLNGLAELTRLYESLRGQVRIDAWELIDPRVEVAGETALLTFNFASRAGDAQDTWNCTEVYQRREGAWRIIQTHWSRTGGTT